MSKEIENRIEELEAMKNERTQNVKEFRKTANAKINELNKKIEETADPFEAVKLNRECEDLKAGLELFNKKNADAQPDIERSECERLTKAVNVEIDALKEDHKTEILEAYRAFEAVMDKYVDEAQGLEELKVRLFRLSNGRVSSSYRANDFSSYENDEPGICGGITNYFNQRAERARKAAALGKWGK